MVEDEFHMMCFCPTYDDLRSEYKITNQHKILDEFCRHMSSQNETVIVKIAAFLYNASKMREGLLTHNNVNDT
jgi:hypothetical protein